MRRKLVSEVLTEAGKAETLELQAILLRTNDSPALREILKIAFDPSVRINTEVPTYRENKETPGCAANNLFIEHRRLYIFIDGKSPVENLKRRSNLLAQILESIDQPDAILLEKAIQKNLSDYGVSKDAVALAFPELIR